MARTQRTITVTVPGTDDLRDWLADGMPYFAGTDVRYVAGDKLAVRVQGYSTCEEDDADYDIADNIKRVIEAHIDDYPGEGG